MGYNRDAFDAAGVSYPDESWDWVALRSAARKLTRDTNADGRVDQWGFVPTYSHEMIDPMIRSFGGEVLNAERTEACLSKNPGAETALQFLVDMIYAHKVAPPPGVSAWFGDGTAAMAIGGSYWIDAGGGFRQSVKKFEWDVATVPKGPNSRVIYGGSDCWAIMRRPGQDIEKAWTVIKELISEEGGLRATIGGRAPVLRNVSKEFMERWLERGVSPKNKKVMLESAPYMRDADWSLGWMQWQPAKNAELAKAFSGSCSVKDALRAADVAINRILQAGKVKK